MGTVIQQSVFLGMLGFSAYRDFREKKVSLYGVLLAGIAGIILHIFYQNHTIADILAGMGVGAVILILSLASGGKIGKGDGMVCIVSGIFLGFRKNVELFVTALTLAGIFAVFLVTVKRKKRDYRMPFLPFLLAAYLFILVH